MYAEAHVPDARVVHINVGCGIVVPMTHEEASRFLVRKEEHHKAEVARLTKEILRIKYRVRVVTETLARLHQRYVSEGAAMR